MTHTFFSISIHNVHLSANDVYEQLLSCQHSNRRIDFGARYPGVTKAFLLDM